MPEIESVVAVYDLYVGQHGCIEPTDGEQFDDQAYSRMKYGVIPDAKDFADKLATTLCESAPELVYGDAPPHLVVAYEAFPHAATLLAHFCLDALNAERARVAQPEGKTLRIYTNDYFEPYSHRPVTERRRILERQRGDVDPVDFSMITPVIVDDIRVTGSQETWFREVLSHHTDQSLFAAYVARFLNTAQHPEIEGKLDDADIDTIEKLLPYIKEGDVAVTHKLVRDLLCAPREVLLRCLDHLSPEHITAIAEGLTRITAETLEPYSANHQTIMRQALLI